MPDVVFTHPDIVTPDGLILPLTIPTGADELAWSYGLNTQTFPTYGGEVVQILSVYIDDVTVKGTLANFTQMEEIYGWFLNFIQMASQGATGPKPYNNYLGADDPGEGEAYNTAPVSMSYLERGWSWKVIPKGLPGFRYGRDVVAPEYELTCAVVQADQAVIEITEAELEKRTLVDPSELFTQDMIKYGDLVDYEGSTWQYSYNRFSAPYKGEYDPKKVEKLLGPKADYYNHLIPHYLDGEISKEGDTLASDFSKPTFGRYGDTNQNQPAASNTTGNNQAPKKTNPPKKK